MLMWFRTVKTLVTIQFLSIMGSDEAVANFTAQVSSPDIQDSISDPGLVSTQHHEHADDYENTSLRGSSSLYEDAVEGSPNGSMRAHMGSSDSIDAAPTRSSQSGPSLPRDCPSSSRQCDPMRRRSSSEVATILRSRVSPEFHAVTQEALRRTARMVESETRGGLIIRPDAHTEVTQYDVVHGMAGRDYAITIITRQLTKNEPKLPERESRVNPSLSRHSCSEEPVYAEVHHSEEPRDGLPSRRDGLPSRLVVGTDSLLHLDGVKDVVAQGILRTQARRQRERGSLDTRDPHEGRFSHELETQSQIQAQVGIETETEDFTAKRCMCCAVL